MASIPSHEQEVCRLQRAKPLLSVEVLSLQEESFRLLFGRAFRRGIFLEELCLVLYLNLDDPSGSTFLVRLLGIVGEPSRSLCSWMIQWIMW